MGVARACRGVCVLWRQDAPAFLLQKAMASRASPSGSNALVQSSVVSIFNWDDTILCTTFLQEAKDSQGDAQDGISQSTAQLMKQIEEEAHKVLSQALRLGRAYIVTNASGGWVEESAAKYLPSLQPLLQKVTIISARDAYEADYPMQASGWKMKAFMQLAFSEDLSGMKDLVVVGDGVEEIHAAHALGSLYTALRIKAIKLRHRPSGLDVLAQLRDLATNFRSIVEKEKDLKYCMGSGTSAGVGNNTKLAGLGKNTKLAL